MHVCMYVRVCECMYVGTYVCIQGFSAETLGKETTCKKRGKDRIILKMILRK